MTLSNTTDQETNTGGSETQFTSTVTSGGPTFATISGRQIAGVGGRKTTTATAQRWLTTSRSRTGTINTPTLTTGGVTGRFTISQRTTVNFNFVDTDEYFEGTDSNFNQFF